ncbi:MAG: hypothetical protein KUG81_08870 [Gammaproteobacteria bacterium]|nr:hypothetical protein [Gammaproteobacteria bacterium]
MMNRIGITHYLVVSLVVGALFMSIAGPMQARQFRQMTPIAGPLAETANLPVNAAPVARLQPLSRGDVEPMVRQVISQWNGGSMEAMLADSFYDKSRLLDVMDTQVPRDARLSIQSIQGVQTLQQYKVPDVDGGRGNLVSIVSATVRTQLEFNSTAGFVRLPGTNEFILKVTTAAAP